MASPPKIGRRTPPVVLLGQGTALGAAVGLVVLLVGLTGAWDGFEAQTWDLRVRTWMAPSKTTGQVALVQLDQTSLDWAETGQQQGWPWPREYYGYLVDFLARAHTKAVVFDVIFTEDSTFGVSDDQRFAQSLAANGHVILGLPVEAGRAVALVPVLKAAAAGVGHVQGHPDGDGTYRRVIPLLATASEVVPSLGWAAFRLGEGHEPTLAVAPNEAVLVNYRGTSGTHRRWSVAQLLRSEQQLLAGEKPEVDPAQFAGKYVVFGFTAQGLRDIRNAPMDGSYPGMEVQATALDNLLAADSPHSVPPAAAWLWALFCSLGAGVAVRVSQKPRTAPLVFAAALALPLGVAWAAYPLGWWVPLVAPLLAGVLATVLAVLVNYIAEGRQKRFIHSAFSQYLSPVVIQQLMDDPGKLSLGGEKRCLSIFFSDIQGFSRISERLDPVSLTALLNDYLSEMTGIIYRYGGTIDKYEGDAVIAFWNAPLDQKDHASLAVQASMECQKRLAEIQPRLSALAGSPVVARVGLNSGDVVIGNMGSSQRFNYTFLGDAGNLASRLEGLNKQFGTYFMVSGHTKALAGALDVHWREISRVRVVGKSEAVTVFEPLHPAVAAERRCELETFDSGLQAWYRGDFAAALELLAPLEASDPPSAHYCARLRHYVVSPPSLWDGVWESTEK